MSLADPKFVEGSAAAAFVGDAYQRGSARGSLAAAAVAFWAAYTRADLSHRRTLIADLIELTEGYAREGERWGEMATGLRESLIRSAQRASAEPVALEDCDCDDRSWHGQNHDSACPLAGISRELPDYASPQDACEDDALAIGDHFTVAEGGVFTLIEAGGKRLVIERLAAT